MSRVAVLSVAVTSLLLVSVTTVSAQQNCNCDAVRPFGSCRINELSSAHPFPGAFPGSIAVLRSGGEDFFVAPDYFSGQTYIFHHRDSGVPGVVLGFTGRFSSPRGSETTTGVVYVEPEDRLYWAIDNRLIVTETLQLTAETSFVVPFGRTSDEEPHPFTDALDEEQPIEWVVDMEGLAERELGDASLAGELGGITYHAGRGTLFGIDIVNDIVFEFQLDGSLGTVAFPHPSATQTEAAYGNSLTYVATDDGEYLDLLGGSLIDGRPTRVIRVTAPTDGESGTQIGVSYPLFNGNLLPPTAADQIFPTGLVYESTTCGRDGTASELVLGFNPLASDPVGGVEKHLFIKVNTSPPGVRGVLDLRAAPASLSEIRLDWANTDAEAQSLVISRSQDGGPSQEIRTYASPNIPNFHLDGDLPFPDADGTYTYEVVTIGADGSESLPATAATSFGRGSSLGSASVDVGSPGGLARVENQLLVVDQLDGESALLDIDTLAPASRLTSPFVGTGGLTRGAAYRPAGQKLFWVGDVDRIPVIESTDVDGSNPGGSRVIRYPSEFQGSPDIGGVAFDETNDQFWLVDTRHDAIFAVDTQGILRRREPSEGDPGIDTVKTNPIDGTLAGGISFVEGTADSVTLDFATVEGTVERRVFDRATMTAQPVTTFALGHIAVSGELGGIDGGTYEGEPALFVLDSRRKELHAIQTSNNPLPPGARFQRGDANNDDSLNISDASFILSWRFKSGAAPACEQAADANGDGQVGLSDAIAIFSYLFRQAEALPDPFQACGFGGSDNTLTCDASSCASQ